MRNYRVKSLSIFLVPLIFFSTACSLVGVRKEESPKYKVLLENKDKQIRQYSSYIVAKTLVSGSYEEAQSEAFKRLAAYIFGENTKKTKMSMTAPVTQSQSTEIKMTAPVTQKLSDGGWEMAFYMPSQYTMESLPKPLNKKIIIEEIPSRIMAAIEFTWLTSKKRNAKKAKELKNWIRSMPDYKAKSAWIYAGYDPPWTIPFFRRQEVLIELEFTKDVK